MQVALLRNGPFQAPPVDGTTLPFADVSVQYILDVLYDEVDGHWQERLSLKRFTVRGGGGCDERSPFEETLTHVVDSSWNDDIYVLLCLVKREISSVQWSDLKKTLKDAFILTGKQNSSKAGLTNVVYCVRICSRSLPRLMSRRTARTIKKRIVLCFCHTVCGNIWNTVSEVDSFTSTGQSDI